MMDDKLEDLPSQNVFNLGCVTFASNFDNGNLARVKKIELGLPYEYRVWVAPDNQGTSYQSKQNAWFHFVVSGVPKGNILRIQIANASNHSGLYRYDMRPVYRSSSTNQKWTRIRNSVRYEKQEDTPPQVTFDHVTEVNDDVVYFAFTYPYTYQMVQDDMKTIDELASNIDLKIPDRIYCCRELAINSIDGLRIDLVTITSSCGVHSQELREPNLIGLFPSNMQKDKPTIKKRNSITNTASNSNSNDENEKRKNDKNSEKKSGKKSEKNEDKLEEILDPDNSSRPYIFPSKEIVFISARVHPGEVPAQHTWKGIFNLLIDADDLIAIELRRRYVFKMIPMLNPDGVYRGHFRMDQMGENLNRYYCNPNRIKQPSIFAAKSLIEYYAQSRKLCFYLDLHAHASKRGCFIYGNVLEDVNDQIQNQLYCKLISLNSAHFEYEACLFNREHMKRVDPADMLKGLTAEGSGRVSTYLSHNLIHSYTLECNYNMSRVGNEITACESESKGSSSSPPSTLNSSPGKYTPACYAGVGRACVISLLDIRNQNPCSRISTSKFKTLDRVRQSILEEVRSKREYRDQSTRGRRHTNSVTPVQGPGTSGKNSNLNLNLRRNSTLDSKTWRSYADGIINSFNDEKEIEKSKKKGEKNIIRRSTVQVEVKIKMSTYCDTSQKGGSERGSERGSEGGRCPWLLSDQSTPPKLSSISPIASSSSSSLFGVRKTGSGSGSDSTFSGRTNRSDDNSNRKNSDSPKQAALPLPLPQFMSTLSTPKVRLSTPKMSTSTRYSNILDDEVESKVVPRQLFEKNLSEKNDEKNPKRKISFFQMDLPESLQPKYIIGKQIPNVHKLISKTKEVNGKKESDVIKNESEAKTIEEEDIDNDLSQLIKKNCFISDILPTQTPISTTNRTTQKPAQNVNKSLIEQSSNKIPDSFLVTIIERAKNIPQQIGIGCSAISSNIDNDNNNNDNNNNKINDNDDNSNYNNCDQNNVRKELVTTLCNHQLIPIVIKNTSLPSNSINIISSEKEEKSEKFVSSFSLQKIRSIDSENSDFENRMNSVESHLSLKSKNEKLNKSNLREMKMNCQNLRTNSTLNCCLETQNNILGAIPGGKLTYSTGKISLFKLPRKSSDDNNVFSLKDSTKEKCRSKNCEKFDSNEFELKDKKYYGYENSIERGREKEKGSEKDRDKEEGNNVRNGAMILVAEALSDRSSGSGNFSSASRPL